jgi:hypothetical protein
MNQEHRLAARREFSKGRLDRLRGLLGEIPEVKRLPNLSIYVTGSYGRNEASEHSDIDLFFVHTGRAASSQVLRLDELRLFAGVIEIGETMHFPTFSNDGEFLQILYLDDMLDTLGGRSDDYANYFTARMLLLLESTPLLNDPLYGSMMDAVVEAYFRDYPEHAVDFRPVFLINDVLRFWKTLCLNYEHRRNKPEGDEQQRRKQQVKNFKLKFSRLLSCFGTVVAVCSKSAPITKTQVVDLTTATPLERFRNATEGVHDLARVREAILEDYQWFLGNTELSTTALTEKFNSKEAKIELFRRADVFGQRMYEVLDYFAGRNNYRRYLVI